MLPGTEQDEPTGAEQSWLFQNRNALACLLVRWLGSKLAVQGAGRGAGNHRSPFLAKYRLKGLAGRRLFGFPG